MFNEDVYFLIFWLGLTNTESEGNPNMMMKVDFLVMMSSYIREDIKIKNTLQFGHCPNLGGGVYPCPNFFDTFLTN